MWKTIYETFFMKLFGDGRTLPIRRWIGKSERLPALINQKNVTDRQVAEQEGRSLSLIRNYRMVRKSL